MKGGPGWPSHQARSADVRRSKVKGRQRRTECVLCVALLLAALITLAGCASEETKGSVAAVHGLDAVPVGYALVVEGNTAGESGERTARSLVIPELGIFRMETEGASGWNEMALTVRTPASQLGYRGQAVLQGKPRPLEMAFLESPLTYSQDNWTLRDSNTNGNHVSAVLVRGIKPGLEEMKVEADLDPQTGIITREVLKDEHSTDVITRTLVSLDSPPFPRSTR
jgi:hypothetical protein